MNMFYTTFRNVKAFTFLMYRYKILFYNAFLKWKCFFISLIKKRPFAPEKFTLEKSVSRSSQETYIDISKETYSMYMLSKTIIFLNT